MGDELKRFALLAVLVLVVAIGLLLPFSKWGVPRRPDNARSTAVFSNGGEWDA